MNDFYRVVDSVTTPNHSTDASAALIVAMARQQKNACQSFRYCPATGSTVRFNDTTPRSPFLTVSGGVQDLSQMLLSFEAWDGSVEIGVLDDQGLLDFWIY